MTWHSNNFPVKVHRVVRILICMVLTGLFWGAMITAPVYAWNDETHLAVAKAAGYYRWFNTAGADMAKTKAGDIEKFNHYFNSVEGREVTADMVMAQVAQYDKADDPRGHLYGAIIAALRKYSSEKHKGKYGEYHLAFAAHYLGDLSQPLHNSPFDDYNRTHHSKTDDIVNDGILDNLDKIKIHMRPVAIRPDHFEEDLASEIARLGELSRRLGERLRQEGRVITPDEAYHQLGHSASLLKAVVEHINLRR